MSRTYRCRNLPKHCRRKSWGSSFAAKKIVEGGGGYRRRRAIIEAKVTEICGPYTGIYRKLVFIKGCTHKVWVEPTYKKYRIGKEAFSFLDKPGHTVERKGKWLPTWEHWYRGWVEDQIEVSLVRNYVSYHPYQRYEAGKRCKTDYKRRANRAWRRENRQIVHSNILDDDFEGAWPTKRKHYNRRDFW